MPPPRPLNLQHSNHARTFPSDYDIHAGQALTPRTPHRSAMSSNVGTSSSNHSSRSLANPTAVYDVDEHELDELEGRNGASTRHQTEPLLASSADATFPHRKSWVSVSTSGFTSKLKGKGKALNAYVLLPSRHTLSRVLEHAPLVLGSSVALLLFFMIIVSFRRPDVLLHAIGASPNVTENESSTTDSPQSISLPTDGIDNSISHSTSKHIISYANYTSFPLTPLQYLTECYKWHANMGRMVGGYWYVPPDGGMDVIHREGGKGVCSSTITYMLDGYVGLSADLALMAQAAAFANEQNRTFLVNDQYWNRGKWIDHFLDVRETQPGPEPGCLPPQPEELAACPHTARHWVLNSRTARFHFGHGFEDAYEDAYARDIRRLKPIYTNSQRSLTRTIRPNAVNSALISSARAEITSLSELNWDDKSQTDPDWDGNSESKGPAYFGVHVRRGDRKAEAFPNVGKYVPLTSYVKAVEDTWTRLVDSGSGSSGDDAGSVGRLPPVVWLATDAPEVVEEFTKLMISAPVAKKNGDPDVLSLSTSVNPQLQAIASRQAYVQDEFAQRPVEERVRETRGIIVDLAMISGLWFDENDVVDSDANALAAVICTLSSNVCKIAAIGFGWERAFGFDPADREGASTSSAQHGANVQDSIDEARKRWVEIDDKGNIAPVWRAFELF